MNKKEQQRLVNEGYDLKLIAHTQPQGNIDLSLDPFIKLGDGLVSCLHVYDFPTENMKYFWLMDIVDYEHTVCTLAIGNEDERKVLKSLQRSTDELRSQAKDPNAKLDAQDEAWEKFDSQRELMQKLRHSEVMKRIDLRIFVYDRGEEELNKRIDHIVQGINAVSFKARAFLGEQGSEFRSFLLPEMKQEKLPNHRKGTPVISSVIGHGFFFNHVKLSDPKGSYFGKSRTNGEIMLDPLFIGGTRLTPFFMTTGRPRYGKSTFSKMLNDDVFMRNGKLRYFDPSGEYVKQTLDQGGKVIDLAGAENRINPFEVFPTATTTDGSKPDEIGSFNMHVEKLVNMFGFINPDATNDDKIQLRKLLSTFYIERGLYVKNPNKPEEMQKIMVLGLPHDQYPTMGEFVEFLNRTQRGFSTPGNTKYTNEQKSSIGRIANTFEQMMTSYREIFDGPTEIEDFADISAVNFKVDGLLAKGKGVFNAQVSSCLSLISADVVNNGKRYRNLLNNRQINVDDIPYYWITMDEFQNYANPDFADGIEWLANLMQQMAKNFCGLNVIMPTMKDFLPKSNQLASSDRMNRFRTAMDKIYGLFTYRTYFHLSEDDTNSLESIMGNSVTPGELASVSKLDKHEALMSIDGGGNYTFTVQPTSAQLMRYQGGIG
ncbi:ATP-binding protein [Fructilactobacillus cliffordii]|uniref:ATP-binding protein n=1 Tax=Fructilactobacillus cliffordii TaxID=2940299 RepID=A0A9Q8ZQX6_9LACO|nr:ATP-binding protein [Fructilactobacillus cliffordii]USS89995.1 ATP-binding protein [Fructilactobacillus cliffordii]